MLQLSVGGPPFVYADPLNLAHQVHSEHRRFSVMEIYYFSFFFFRTLNNNRLLVLIILFTVNKIGYMKIMNENFSRNIRECQIQFCLTTIVC